MKFPIWLRGGLIGICFLIIYLTCFLFTSSAPEPPNRLIQVLELGIFLIMPAFIFGSIAGLILGRILNSSK